MCGGGTALRTRACHGTAKNEDGEDKAAICGGLLLEGRACNAIPCPPSGHWTYWEGWTACSKSCEAGKKNRTRTCMLPRTRTGRM